MYVDDTQPGREQAREDDLRARLLRFYLLFAGLLLVAAFSVALVMTNRLNQQAQTAVAQHAQSIARQLDALPPETEWLALAGLDDSAQLLIVAVDGRVQQQSGRPLLSNEAAWQSWQTGAVRQLAAAGGGHLITTDPEGSRWLHGYAATPDGTRGVLLQLPTAVAFAHTRLLGRVWVIALMMFLAGGLFSWMLLSHQIIKPLEQLEVYSGLIRWRGQMRPEEKAQLDQLAARSDQIGSLARSLMAMEADIHTRFVQLSTLLETGRAVAASLDVMAVLNSILEQVQNLFHVERCAIVALDQRAGVFRVRASRGLSDAYVKQLRITPSEPNSPSMRALRNQTPIQVSNTETDLAFAAFRPRARAEGYQSVLAVPLKAQHALPAVLLLYKGGPYRYSYSELELASSFAHHASIAMENAALYARTDERLQEQTRRLEAIVESLADGLVLEGTDGRVLYCNHQAAEWLGASRQDARQQTGAALFARLAATFTDPDSARQHYETAVAGHGEHTFDVVAAGAHGRQHDLRLHLFAVTDAQGEPLGRGQLWQDITKDKELDRMKSALLSTVSHELRTPLATIKGYASTLLANDVAWDAATQREFLQTISQETDRLTTLVKNLLDLSRIEAGLLDIHCEVYSLNDLLAEVMRSFTPPVYGRVHLQLAADLPPISIDISRMSTVMRNLVDNAVKYSPPDTPIEVSTARQNGDITFTVRDFGPGVPPELADKIFDRFVRADNRLTREVGGVGLGLAICKGFVAAHHGRVWFQPANPGAVFGFTLPMQDACDDT